MLPDYQDIRSRITEQPKWFDRHGVPRYCEPTPDECSNIYADVVVFYRIRCQECGAKFIVEDVEGLTDRVLHPEGTPLLECVRLRALHYGDPPRHNQSGCAAGGTMSCEDERVIAVWQKDQDFEWKRLAEFDGYDLESEDEPIHTKEATA